MTVRALPADAGARGSARTSVATAAVSAVNRLSRALGRGSGTVAGGRVGLLVDPGLLATSAAGRQRRPGDRAPTARPPPPGCWPPRSAGPDGAGRW